MRSGAAATACRCHRKCHDGYGFCFVPIYCRGRRVSIRTIDSSHFDQRSFFGHPLDALSGALAANAIIRERARLRGHDPDAIKRCISRACEAIKNSRILLDRVEARQRAEEWHYVRPLADTGSLHLRGAISRHETALAVSRPQL